MRKRLGVALSVLLAVAVVAPVSSAAAEEEATLEGELVANGETIALPYVYVYAESEGFYDESDPTWEVVFAAEPIPERDVDDPFFPFPYVKVGVTISDAHGEEPELQVYSQNVKLSSDGGNLSGGTYPEIEAESTGPGRFVARIYHPEPTEFFDDTFQYDFTFSAPFSDPNAPIGDPLPADGGEPGQAYLTWVDALQELDLERLKTLVPADMAAMLDTPEAMEEVEFMRDLTPTDVKILGGSTDGETALLDVRGMMDGAAVAGDVTLVRQGDFWIPTDSAWRDAED